MYAKDLDGSWEITTVEAGLDVGVLSRLGLDGRGEPHVANVDSANGEIHQAH